MNESSNKPMTVRAAVESIIKDLGEIPVPISQMESVGFPIARSIQNLKIICAAWDAEEAKKNGNSLADNINEAIQEAVKLEEVKEEREDGR